MLMFSSKMHLTRFYHELIRKKIFYIIGHYENKKLIDAPFHRKTI